MKLNKKRKKSTRMHGSHTHGKGFKKKGRGSGHRGGFGMAGTGKKADQKKTLITNMKEKYFGKKGLLAKKKKYKTINLYKINEIARGKKEIDLSNYKILGNGELNVKIKIKCYAASDSAIEKIKKAGSELNLINKKSDN